MQDRGVLRVTLLRMQVLEIVLAILCVEGGLWGRGLIRWNETSGRSEDMLVLRFDAPHREHPGLPEPIRNPSFPILRVNCG